MATGVALSHDMFDAAVYLGICDKIVPGLLIGALTFGHLPAVFMPGRADDHRPAQRREGRRSASSTPKARSAATSCSRPRRSPTTAPGTCTFYGTANSNQMLMEIMGLHLPGASFVNPNTPLRDALTARRRARALAITALGNDYTPVGAGVDERAIVNGDRRRCTRPAARPTTRSTWSRWRAAAGIALDLGRLRRPLGGRAAAGARLSERRSPT